MKKKSYGLILITALIIHTFGTSFSYASNESQSEVCYGPSYEMGLYMQFQEEILSALGGNALNEKRYSVSLNDDGLFSQKILDLPTTALSLAHASIVGHLQALTSASSTTAVLIALSTASVVQSNIEGFGILFKDRPIVRDYKSLLDIETKITQAAYYKSQEVSLTKPFEGDFTKTLSDIIEKYKELGLLSEDSKVNKSFTLSNLFYGMTAMNARMKKFLAFDGDRLNVLQKEGCRGEKDDNCNIKVNLSKETINNLIASYDGLGNFGSCNKSFTYFNNNIKKTVSNNGDSVKKSIQDIKESFVRLFTTKNNISNQSNYYNKDSKCQDMSEYKIAQMEAYRGSNWSCNDTSRIKVGSLATAKKNILLFAESSKEARNSIKHTFITAKKNILLFAESSKEARDSIKHTFINAIDTIKDSKKSMAEKNNARYKMFSTGSYFNTEFNNSLQVEYTQIFTETMASYQQSEIDAMSSDLSDELVNIMALTAQIDALSDIIGNDSAGAQGTLRKVIKYQCSS